jgi:hypothetical protein
MKKLLFSILLLALLVAPASATVTSFVGNTFYGLSTDTKPTVMDGSRFWESDTKKWYVRQGGSWIDWTPTGSGTPSDTVSDETTFGQSAGAGTASSYSRGDHTHGTPTYPILPDDATFQHVSINNSEKSIWLSNSLPVDLSLTNRNTGIGNSVAPSITTGAIDNVFIGYRSGYELTGGLDNTCVGEYSCRYITTGESNTSIGLGSGLVSGTDGATSNTVTIGNLARADGSNMLVIGSGTSPLYHVWLGEGRTPEPDSAPGATTLHVSDSIGTDIAGATLKFAAGAGTGAGQGGAIVFQVAPAGASGSTNNTLQDALTINQNKSITVNGSFSESNVTYSTTAGHKHSGTDSTLVPYAASIASTGYLSGGTITITSGQPAKFDMTAGTGIVVNNYTNPNSPTLTPVSWPARTAQTLTYLASADETALGIDSSGNIVQHNSPFTEDEWADIIQIATIGHWSRTQIDYIIMEPLRVYDVMRQLQGFLAALGPFAMGGNEYTANGANMKLNKSGGTTFYQGGGSSLKPNTISSSSGTAVYFSYYYESSPGVWVETALTQTIDDLKYNTGSGLGTVPVGKYTIQTIFFYAPLWVNGGSTEYSTDIQYGQVVYDTLAQAAAAITNNIRFYDYLSYDTFRTWLIVKRGTTSLQNAADALFVQSPPLKFGIMAATGGGSTGEANTASNIGTAGVGLYDSKVGVDLRFKNPASLTSGLTIVDNPTNHTVDFTVTGLVTNGDSHDHNGGDGGQIAYTSLSALPTLPSTISCSGTDKVRAYTSTTGVFTCAADVTGGAGSFSITQTEVDAGWPLSVSKSFTITDANISAGMKLMATVAYEDTSDGRPADDYELTLPEVTVGKAAAGSFTLILWSRTGWVGGKYKINYTYVL